MTSRLNAYLQRIGYDGPLNPSYATLRGLHRAHLLNITYENLDIHRGRTLSLDENAIFDKLVTARRGGWCYEMNGLFAWALRELGFAVTLLAGTVNRPIQGSSAEGNHLILKVDLDRPYLADVGFGNGFLEPLPLAAGSYQQGYLTYHLHSHNERWYFQNHAYGGAGFDFTLQPCQMSDFAARCHWLQTSPESGFVRLTVCHRFTPHGLITLRGAVLRTVTAAGAAEQVVDHLADYDRILQEKFDLRLDDVAELWQKVWQKHQVWLAG